MSRRPFNRSNNNHRKKATKKAGQNKNNLPKNAPLIEVEITHIGGRGDGVGTAAFTHNYETKDHQIFVPDTLVGERIMAKPLTLTGQGIQASLVELISPSALRKNPDCGASPACGGCQFQHMEKSAYQSWKSEMLAAILTRQGIEPASWRPAYHGTSHKRRRARLAIRRRKDDVLIGFRERASHQIIYPQDCSILAAPIMTLIDQMRDKLLHALKDGMTGEVDITLCDNGCDVSLHGDPFQDAPWPAEVITNLTLSAADFDIARLSLFEKNQPTTLLFVKDPPQIKWQLPEQASKSHTTLLPAPASFLQADGDAEMVMKTDIFEALSGSHTILDLFSGSGTLSAPLLFQDPPAHRIDAFDSVQDALAAYDHIADNHGLSMHLETAMRNLFDAPLTPKELGGYEAVIIDPPRAGALAQMPALAASDIPKIMMVSCNPHSFARDAALLIEGGYQCLWARHIDQFALTAHSEIVAFFTKEIQDA